MSLDLSYYAMMADYNRWMNRNLYAVCALMPDAVRRQECGIFFRSIHGTLNHLLYGDRSWLGRFTGEPFEVTVIGQELYSDFAELQAEREATDERIIAWAQTLTPEWLQSPFSYTSNVDGKTRVLPAWTLVVHLFNHQTHHRGQITTLLSQLGYDAPVTDLPWLPGLEAVRDAER